MSALGGWAKKHLSVRLDSHTLGNLAKNAAPAAAFTPLGVVGSGLLGAVGELGRGKNIGEAAKAGLSSAAQGAGATSVAGHFGVGPGTHLGFGLGGSSASAPAAAAGGPPPPVSTGGLALPSVPNLTVAQTAPHMSLGANALNKAGSVLDFAAAHPTAAAGALQGLGNIASSGSENRLNQAKASELEQQANETAYDFERRKQRDAALAPIWSSLGNSVGNSYAGVARNPYLPTEG